MSKTFLSILNVKSNFISVPYFNYDQKCTEVFNLGQTKLKKTSECLFLARGNGRAKKRLATSGQLSPVSVKNRSNLTCLSEAPSHFFLSALED